MKRKLTIEYNWKRSDNKSIDNDTQDALEEAAWDRISFMMNGGYTSGELHTAIYMADSDEPEVHHDVEFTGHWSVTMGTL